MRLKQKIKYDELEDVVHMKNEPLFGRELYHGCNHVVGQPKFDVGRAKTDFGKGFYLMDSELSAKRWSMDQSDLSAVAIVNKYILRNADLRIKRFSLGVEWLFYVIYNREHKAGKGIASSEEWERFREGLGDFKRHETDFDAIIGPTADDQLINSISCFLNGACTDEQTLAALAVQDLPDQCCLKSRREIESVEFDGFAELDYKEKSRLKVELDEKRKIASDQALAAARGKSGTGHDISFYIERFHKSLQEF
jgi:hypothetical protein